MSTALESQPVEIFRAGNYGNLGVITSADVARVASTYNAENHEAPIVIGHPTSNGPAWGWVKSLQADNGLLLANFADVDPDFADMFEKKRFKKRSASFYKDATSGAITGLRHVGFLGAKPPEVKGLRDVQFDDAARESIEVNFEESDMSENANETKLVDSIVDRLKDIFKLKPNEAAATANFTEAEVDARVDAKTKELRDQVTKLVADFGEREEKVATAETKNRATAAIAKLKGSKSWVPAFDKMNLTVVFEELAKSENTVEFSEGDTKVKKTPLEIFVEFMESAGEIVPGGRTVDRQAAGAAARAVPANADPTSVQFSEAIRARMKDKGETYTVAMDHVAQERPELTATRTGGATAGQV